jgi:uncharacterized membrane protein
MQTDPPTTRPRRLFKVVLVLSLALNLLFVGLIAGAAWRHGGDGFHRGHAGGDWRGFAAPYVRALPREDRRALFKDLRGMHPRPDQAARRAPYDLMLTALRADPFDADRVAAILTEQQSRAVDMHGTARDSWLAAVAAMSGPDRAAYADRLEEIIERGPRRRSRDRD